MGDAVTGINRADTASGKLNGTMLRQSSMLCNINGGRAGGQCSRCPMALSAWLTTGPLNALLRAAYPPPRESCVRGADRAAVDKPVNCLNRPGNDGAGPSIESLFEPHVVPLAIGDKRLTDLQSQHCVVTDTSSIFEERFDALGGPECACRRAPTNRPCGQPPGANALTEAAKI